MAKKFRNTRCVYCLQFFEELTSDHVFPKSWYPKTTPLNLKKWQVPACGECNSKYSKVEGELLQIAGLCLDPTEFKSLGIADKVLRSLDPGSGRTDTDRLHRQKQQEKVLKSLVPGHKIPREACLPGFGPQGDVPLEKQMGVLVPERQLKVLGEKLVRGITHLKNKTYIDQNHKVDVFFAPEEGGQLVANEIKHFGQEHHCGPGIRIGVAFLPDDPQSGLFDIEIWGKWPMYATVTPKK